MSSRMAVSDPGQFKAVAIASASSPVVPIATMASYRDALSQQGHAVSTLIDPTAQHEWIPAAPAAVLAWFDKYP